MASTAENISSALSPAADHDDIVTMSGATADNISGATSPAASQGNAAGAAAACVSCDGVTFTLTEDNKVAEVVPASGGGAAVRVLSTESFPDVVSGTRFHFVDVQGDAEAMLFLVSVQEDQRRILSVTRFF